MQSFRSALFEAAENIVRIVEHDVRFVEGAGGLSFGTWLEEPEALRIIKSVESDVGRDDSPVCPTSEKDDARLRMSLANGLEHWQPQYGIAESARSNHEDGISFSSQIKSPTGMGAKASPA